MRVAHLAHDFTGIAVDCVTWMAIRTLFRLLYQTVLQSYAYPFKKLPWIHIKQSMYKRQTLLPPN